MISIRNKAAAFAALLLLLAGAASAAPSPDPRLRWEKKWGPLVPHKKFAKDCGICHVARRWDVVRPDFKFDHLRETGYALTGAHAQAACLRCHNDRGPIKAYVARGCGGCHVDQHKGTLGIDCVRCHNEAAWTVSGRQSEKIARHAQTRFPLSGMHAAIECRECHIRADNGEFRGAPLDCYSCHASNFQTAPGHVSSNFSTNCAQCHNLNSWLGAGFNHSSLGASPVCYACHQTDFAKANTTPASRHAANSFPTTCASCHTFAATPPPWGPGTTMNHSVVGGTGASCIQCHTNDYNTASNPSHLSPTPFSTACMTCHVGTSSWLGAIYNHSGVAGYPSPVCWTCHQTDYNAAKTTPASNHTANTFPQTCADCHTFSATPPPWGPGTAMNHNAASIGGTAANCIQCHTNDYNTAVPSHLTPTAFGTACMTCHTGTTSWLGAAYNHSGVAGYPSPVCWTCHQSDYAAAKTTPASSHTANTFPQTCADCHTFSATPPPWGPGTAMNHTAASVGGASATCQKCHLGDYNGATTPVNHASSGIPSSSCNTCHTTFTSWTGFTHSPSTCFNSSSDSAHHNAKCSQCHSGGVYTTYTCTACHGGAAPNGGVCN